MQNSILVYLLCSGSPTHAWIFVSRAGFMGHMRSPKIAMKVPAPVGKHLRHWVAMLKLLDFGGGLWALPMPGYTGMLE